MHLTVLYLAALRDQRGHERDDLITTAATTGALYDELRQRHGFGFTRTQLGVAVGEHLVGWDAAITDGDTVVLLPPVSGG